MKKFEINFTIYSSSEWANKKHSQIIEASSLEEATQKGREWAEERSSYGDADVYLDSVTEIKEASPAPEDATPFLLRKLTAFVKEAQKEPFEGVSYFLLSREYSEPLYLVLSWAEDEENGNLTLWGKIAYNCDDLQCDYTWDWDQVIIKGEVFDTEISGIENCDPKEYGSDILKDLETILESSKDYINAYKDFIMESYDEEIDPEPGSMLSVLYSTFDTDDSDEGREVDIQVNYNPVEEEYEILLDGGEKTIKDPATMAEFARDMEVDWQSLYEYFVGIAREHLDD